jgi:hypothetical protein
MKKEKRQQTRFGASRVVPESFELGTCQRRGDQSLCLLCGSSGLLKNRVRLTLQLSYLELRCSILYSCGIIIEQSCRAWTVAYSITLFSKCHLWLINLIKMAYPQRCSKLSVFLRHYNPQSNLLKKKKLR